MAKMFYTLEETAQKLGVPEDNVRDMAGEGKLQQFRDRDKLMFKRDQVDALLAEREADETGEIELDQTSGLGDIDLTEGSGLEDKSHDSRMRTGISVFDADEIEMADPLAQTVVTRDSGDELSLEGVGSGSGLLDLTRESDDTSLGAELLDEIYPGSGEGSDMALDEASSTGAFDSGITIEPSGTGLDHLVPGGSPLGAGPVVEQTIIVEENPWDPAGNGLSIGMLVFALIGMVVMGMVMLPTAMGKNTAVVDWFVGDQTKSGPLWMIIGGLLAGAVIFGLAGLFFGMSRAKSAA